MIRPVQRDLFGVIGNPVKHSLSPVMMTAAFEALRVPAVYLALEVDNVEADLATLSLAGYRGLSVTIPHKEHAYRLAVAADLTAEVIGAVNTLRRTNGGWEGRNTDWIGANRALGEAGTLKGKRALVIGAGGAARAVAYGLMRAGGQVTLANRSVSKGNALAKALGCDFIPLEELRRRGGDHSFQIAVQCTPMGLSGDASVVVPPSFFHPGMVVMDTVYRPLWTPFALAARDGGCTVVSGLEMLLHQGVAQLTWWLEEEAINVEEAIGPMREALLKAVEND
jgi:shikimate dehydrogenase